MTLWSQLFGKKKSTGTGRELPKLLKELHAIDIDYYEDIDFEPFEEFFSKEETSDWIKAWTGNKEIDGSEFLVFGQDATGGYAAFWCVTETKNTLDQPIVFFGSEGEIGVVARNFYEYLWLFANGFGPYEAVMWPEGEEVRNEEFYIFAEKHASLHKSTVIEVIEKAVNAYPEFKSYINSLCR